jgi:hypothetical protein
MPSVALFRHMTCLFHLLGFGLLIGNEPMPLYHSSPVLLEIGSVVLPGNYGRILYARGKAHPLWERERTLEQVRKQRYSAKPSRLTSTFSCTSLDTARFYARVPSLKGEVALYPVLYEVEKVDPAAIEHRADFNVVQPLAGRPETMSEIATMYWEATMWINVAGAPGIRCEEMVTHSALRILRQV